MKKRNKISFILGLVILMSSLVQCRFGSKNKDEVDIKFEKGKNLNAKEWQCYDIDNNKICIPSKWTYVKQDVALFFARINNDKNSFFGIVKNDSLDIEEYLKIGFKETVKETLKDSTEVFTGYTLKKITFKNKEAYYGEYFTTIGKTEYFTYSMGFEQEGCVYDVGLKLKKADSPNYKDTFKDILFNFRINNKLVFDEHDKIIKIDTIDLSKGM